MPGCIFSQADPRSHNKHLSVRASRAGLKSAAAQGSLQSPQWGGEGAEQGLFALQLRGTAHHQPSLPSANLVGQPAPDFWMAFLS